MFFCKEESTVGIIDLVLDITERQDCSSQELAGLNCILLELGMTKAAMEKLTKDLWVLQAITCIFLGINKCSSAVQKAKPA